MEKTLTLFAMGLIAFILLGSQRAVSQERVAVKVKGSEVVTGVVIVHVQKDGKSLDLQCNEGSTSCKPLTSGSYMMVELPKNYGMYDCKNVEIYQGSQDKPEAAQKLGAYCIVEN